MKSIKLSRNNEWLYAENLQNLLSVLSEDGEEARVVGGAVRNSLLGKPIADIDIATTLSPDAIIRRATAAGFHAVPTGVAFGTVTVVADGQPFEVTTLRADIETDGRHAKVAFGRDWQIDANRRDFTINALYVDACANIYDYVEGLQDIETATLRFIGKAEDRIKEDYLRILRFFRFFAWYGDGRPDAEGLKAAAKLKQGLNQLSAERVWHEVKKLLCAADPSRALLWMRQTGVLAEILPETEKWGIDAIHSLVETERLFNWDIDPLLRLESLVPPDEERCNRLASRFKLTNKDKRRLKEWAKVAPVTLEMHCRQLKIQLYRIGREAIIDTLKLQLAKARQNANMSAHELEKSVHYSELLTFAESWIVPEFPVNGRDLLALGFDGNHVLGDKLQELEDLWVQSGFQQTREQLLHILRQQIKEQ